MVDRISGLVGDLGVKAPVRAYAATNITLSGLQTIDGVVLAADDRVLVGGQTSSIDNGIYSASTGAWARTPDCDGARDLVGGTLIFIVSGSVYALSFATVVGAGAKTPGVDALTFTNPVVQAPGGNASQTFSAAAATAADHVVRLDQFQVSRQLGYYEITASQGSITTEVDVTSLSIAVAVATGQRIKVSFSCYDIESTVLTDDIDIAIKEGTTSLNYSRTVGKGHNNCTVYLSPTAGNHTYKITAQRSAGTGTVTLNAGALYPAYIVAELV